MTDPEIDAILREVFAPAAAYINGKRVTATDNIIERTRFCERAAVEAPDRDSAKVAYLAAMPLLTDRSSALAFIACAARGIGLGYITALEASKLVYVAQTTLAAIARERY